MASDQHHTRPAADERGIDSLKHWRWLAWATFAVLSTLQISRTDLTTDITAFLPGASDARQRLIISQLHDGVSTRLVVIGLALAEQNPKDKTSVAVAPAERAALATMSNRLRDGLAEIDSIDWVSNGDLSHHHKERDRLFEARYLLSPGISADTFTATQLRSSFLTLQRELTSARSIAIRSIATADPTLESLELLAQGSGALASMHENTGVWFSEDGRAALLVFTTKAGGEDVAAVNAAIDQARQAAEQVLRDWPIEADSGSGRTAHEPTVGFAGAGYFNASSQQAIGSESIALVLIALALISTLILWALRSPRVLLLALLPVASGALAGYAVVGLGYGSIHATTLGFGVTLLGEAVDYVIYTAVQRGRDGRHSPHFWSKFQLALLTSLVGFAAMVLSGFQGLQQLGLFSIVGLSVAALCTRFLIPELLTTTLPDRPRVNAGAGATRHLPAIARHARVLRWPVIIAALLATVWLHQREAPLWQDGLEILSTTSAAKTDRDLQWRQAINQPDLRTMLVVHGANLEEALLRAEKLQPELTRLFKAGQLEAFHNPATWLPSLQTQKARLAALPEAAQLRETIANALEQTQLRAAAFEPFVAAIDRTREKGPLTLADYEGTITGSWLNGQIVRSGDGVHLLILLQKAPPTPILDAWLARSGVPGVSTLDLQREVEALVGTYRHQALLTALAGAVGIVAMLAFRVKRIASVVSMVAALVTCIILTSSVLVASATSLSVFHLVALLLVVGVVSNYTLFFASLPPDPDERRRVSLSVVLAASATIIAFSVLASSSTPLLAMIGATVTIGAVIGLAAALIFSREDARDS